MQGLLLAGRYRLGESIGRGGMGQVWRAHDELLNRDVAVKELTAAQYASDNDRRILFARTQTEARAAARINHPAVVTIHDVLEHDDRPWIVMELVEGTSLADAVRDSGPLEVPQAARVGLWVLRALRAAHAAGVLHRDVKPGNVLLADDGRVLLTDFGIAYMEGDTTLTKTGEIVGSVDYLAPERVHGADPEPACDLWALGATLFTAVDGRSPFRRGTPLATMQAVVDEDMAPPEHAGPLGPVIASLLHKDPGARPTAAEAERMLDEAVQGRTPQVPTQAAETSRTLHYMPAQPYDTHPPHRSVHRTPTGGQAGGGIRYGDRDTHESGVPRPNVGPDTLVPHAGTPYQPPRRRRRGWTVLVAVLAGMALLGGGTVLGLRYAGEKGAPVSEGATTTPPQSASPDPTAEGEDVVPRGWRRVDDPAGFSLAVPEGWQRKVDGSQIDYTPDEGNHFVRISVDRDPDWSSAYEHQLDLERQLKDLPDYRRKQLKANVFRDRGGAVWEFTWTASSSQDPFPGPRHAIEQTYVDRDGVEYALYVSAPEADWEIARHRFTVMLRSWRTI